MGGFESSKASGRPVTFEKIGRALHLKDAAPDEFVLALDAASRDPDVYCVVHDGLSGGRLADGPTGADAARAIWRIDRFGKPFVSVLQGAVPWERFAYAINGTHKVADPEMTISFGGVASGQVPAFGASYHLPALPRNLGLYLALTGSALDSALAYSVGWLTHRIPSSRFEGIKAALATAEPVDAVLDELDLGPGASPLEPRLDVIERCFSAASPKAILASLDATAGANADWARQCASAMRAVPERTLDATHTLLTAHAQSTLRQSLWLEARIATGNPDVLAPVPLAGDLELPDPAPPSIG